MMKKRRSWTRFFSGLLILSLLLSLPFGASAEPMTPDWTYDNSLLVTVRSEETKAFAPADFPGSGCSAVWNTARTPSDSGVLSEYLLVFSHGTYSSYISDVLKEMRKSVEVVSAVPNEKFAVRPSTLQLGKAYFRLKVGETAQLGIDSVELHVQTTRNIGVVFSVDPALADLADWGKDYFSKHGIIRFWPNTEQKEGILREKPAELEAQPSQDGVYYGLISSSSSYVEVLHALSQSEEILSMSVVQEELPPGGQPPYENWSIDREGLATFSLSGGEIVNGFNENGPRLNQTATVQGVAPGIAVLSVERGGFGAHAKDCCGVLVYQPGSLDNPGDLNRNGTTDAGDALRLLQHSVNLITLSEDEKSRGDLNVDNAFDASDALIVLQISVKIL